MIRIAIEAGACMMCVGDLPWKKARLTLRRWAFKGYNIIIILVFLLVIEMQLCGRAIFWSADNHFFNPNLAASRAQRFNSLLPYVLTLNYLALQYQPLVVIASMRT